MIRYATLALGVLTRISVEQLRDSEKFRSFVRGHIDQNRGNAAAMAQLAPTLSNITDLTSRLPDLVLEAAQAAYDASGTRDAVVAAIYARALYQIGALDRAIAVQQDAVALASTDDREQIQGIFEYYRLCKKLQAKVN